MLMKIPTYDSVARERNAAALECDLAFWRKSAEDLRDQMEELFEQIQKDGEVELTFGSRKVVLVLQQEDK